MLRCAAGRWHERTAGPAMPRRSRDTWAGETSSTTRFPCSPPPMPIKSPAITRNWSQRHSPGAWPRYWTHEAGSRPGQSELARLEYRLARAGDLLEVRQDVLVATELRLFADSFQIHVFD